MARIRTIKPEFHDDEKMATIPRDARLLYIAMWNFSDDYGVIKGHPTWIKNKVFPYDDIKQATFNEWLMGLERLRCIIPFDHNGEKFYFIRTFNEHQRVDKPSQTRNPDPPADILEINRSLFAEDSTNTPRGLPVVREGKGIVREGNSNGSGARARFEKFWESYPKKKSKAQAEKAFAKINPDEQLLAAMIAKIGQARTSDEWTREGGRYIPHPATWLNAKGWEDEIITEADSDEQRLRRLAERKMREENQ